MLSEYKWLREWAGWSNYCVLIALCSESKYLSVLADIYALLTKLYRSRGLIIGPIGRRKIWPFRSSNLELRLGQ